MSLPRPSSNREACIPVSSQALARQHCAQLTLPIAVGILGATVMPHSIFLGSALATQDRVSTSAVNFDDEDEKLSRRITEGSEYENESALDTMVDRRSPWRRWMITFFGYKASTSSEPLRHSEWENNTLDFVRAHLRHAIVNIITSLLGIAVVINSLWVPYYIRQSSTIDAFRS